MTSAAGDACHRCEEERHLTTQAHSALCINPPGFGQKLYARLVDLYLARCVQARPLLVPAVRQRLSETGCVSLNT